MTNYSSTLIFRKMQYNILSDTMINLFQKAFYADLKLHFKSA